MNCPSEESITVVVHMEQLMDNPTSIYRMLEDAKMPVAHTTDPSKLCRVLRGKMITWQDDYTHTVHYKWSPQ